MKGEPINTGELGGSGSSSNLAKSPKRNRPVLKVINSFELMSLNDATAPTNCMSHHSLACTFRPSMKVQIHCATGLSQDSFLRLDTYVKVTCGGQVRCTQPALGGGQSPVQKSANLSNKQFPMAHSMMDSA